ncbi:hypothetical protein [Magnetococcus sp. PR-3]|uniref:hypothetical protein n=1 Tax=Magnetococcus sp. PR-3 TaxID=3120355 RepID=UPI002FCE2A08
MMVVRLLFMVTLLFVGWAELSHPLADTLPQVQEQTPNGKSTPTLQDEADHPLGWLMGWIFPLLIVFAIWRLMPRNNLTLPPAERKPVAEATSCKVTCGDQVSHPPKSPSE